MPDEGKEGFEAAPNHLQCFTALSSLCSRGVMAAAAAGQGGVAASFFLFENSLLLVPVSNLCAVRESWVC